MTKEESASSLDRVYPRKEPGYTLVSSGVLEEQEDELQKSIHEQLEWLKQEIISESYLARLTREFSGDKKKAQIAQQLRIDRLRDPKIHLVSRMSIAPGMIHGGYNQSMKVQKAIPVVGESLPLITQFPIQGGIVSKNEEIILEPSSETRNTTPLHELSHKLDDAGFFIPKSTVDLIYQMTRPRESGSNRISMYRQNGYLFHYGNIPSEWIARMREVRFLLEKHKIILQGDTITGDTLQRLSDTLSKDQILPLLELLEYIKGADESFRMKNLGKMFQMIAKGESPSKGIGLSIPWEPSLDFFA